MAVFPESELDKFICLTENIRKRPGMYVFPVTLESLRNFFSGYFSYTTQVDESLAYYNFFESYEPTFNVWIAEKEGGRYSPGSGWVECIMNNVDSDEEGIELFFQHLDEYLITVNGQLN